MTTIVLLALAGAVIAAIIGTIWYSPGTPMGRLHMRFVGFDKLSPEEQKQKMDEMKPQMWKYYTLQILLSLLTSFATVFIITMSVQNGVSFGLALGFVLMNWLCFMVPVIGSAILWGNCERAIAWKKFFSDISANLVILVLIGILTSLVV